MALRAFSFGATSRHLRTSSFGFEWLIAPVLKTGIVRNKELSRVRIPLSPFLLVEYIYIYIIGFFRLSISILKGNCSAIPLAEPEQKKKGSIYNESKMKIKEYFFELWTCSRYRLGVPHQKGHCPCRLYCESYSD